MPAARRFRIGSATVVFAIASGDAGIAFLVTAVGFVLWLSRYVLAAA